MESTDIVSRTYLPVVKPEIGYSLQHAMRSVDDDESYMEQQLAWLEEVNPVIAVWIRAYADRTEDPMGAMYCALTAYKLLDSQAEVNQMI